MTVKHNKVNALDLICAALVCIYIMIIHHSIIAYLIAGALSVAIVEELDA